MKSVFIFLAVAAFLTSCASTNKVGYLPAPPQTQSRQLASNYADEKFKEYFSQGNYFAKLGKINEVAKSLLAVMPDKGSAKKRLVQQFVVDLNKVVAQLGADTESISEKSNRWLPSTQGSGFAEKIILMSQVVESQRVMDRMGIYLTSSDVIDPDNATEDYYYTLIAKAVYEIDNLTRSLTLIYPPEKKAELENAARLRYTRKLAGDVRVNLKKSFDSNKALNRKRIDKVLRQISSSSTLKQAAQFKNSNDYKYAQEALKDLHIMNSQDIDGFEDEIELTLATKFSFEMINELISSVR